MLRIRCPHLLELWVHFLLPLPVPLLLRLHRLVAFGSVSSVDLGGNAPVWLAFRHQSRLGDFGDLLV